MSPLDEHVLFGVLAVRQGVLLCDGLADLCAAWRASGVPRLADFLGAEKRLPPEVVANLTHQVAELIGHHNGNARAALASALDAALREQFERHPNPEVPRLLPTMSLDELPPPLTASPTQASPPTRFQILRLLAEGGLGTVSVALDTELGREVAFKEIKERYADHPNFRARFLLEARLTGRDLEHPGVAPVYALGMDDRGRPFYAMRLIQGERLDKAIRELHRKPAGRERRLALRQLLTRFGTVCQTIAYAHSRSILHRDIKPDNIVLGEYGETLVLDWGIAKPLEQPDLPEGFQPTRGPMGTPLYASPEQFGGDVGRVGFAADIYGLGATLYHLITGRPPFTDRQVEQRWEELNGEEQHAYWEACKERATRGELPTLPRDLRRQIPTALLLICRKAMARKPEERYASAADLARDVERWLGDEAVAAGREPLLERVSRWVRRRAAWVQAVGTALLLIAAAGVIAAILINNAREDEKTQRGIAEGALREKATALEEKGEALRKRIEADQLAERRRAQLFQTEGLRLLNDGHLLLSLPWLAEAYQREEGDPERARIHRLRLTAVHDQCPALAGQWFYQGRLVDLSWNAQLLLTIHEHEAQVRDLATGAVRFRATHDAPVERAVFSPDGGILAAACDDGTVHVWDVRQHRRILEPLRHPRVVKSLVFHPRGLLLLTTCDSADRGDLFKDEVRVWNSRTGVLELPVWKLRAPGLLESSQAAFSEDGRQVLLMEGTLPLPSPDFLDPEKVKAELLSDPIKKPRRYKITAWDLATGQPAASTADEQRRHQRWLWELFARNPLTNQFGLGGAPGTFSALRFSPDEQFVAAAVLGEVQVFRTATGESFSRLMPHPAAVSSVAFTPRRPVPGDCL
jgi:hypothetical protein